MKFMFSLILICACFFTAISNGDETAGRPSALEQFNSIYEILKKADNARDREDMASAVSNYKDALDQYKSFFNRNPNWESSVVEFRIMYCNDQLESCLRKLKINAQKPAVEPSSERAEQPIAAPAAIPVPAKLTKTEIDNVISEGLTLIEKNDPEAARSMLLAYLKLAPDNRLLRLTSAIAQCKCGNYDDAISILESLVGEFPDDTSSRMTLASACLGSGDMARSEQELLTVIKNSPLTKEAYYDLAQAYLSMTPPDINRAAQYYKKWIGLGGKPNPAMTQLIEQK